MVALVGVAALMAGTGAGFTVIVRALVAAVPILSCTWSVKVTVAAETPGVPVITPVLALSDSQEGLLTVDQVYGAPLPPEAVGVNV
jgi:hypothetical protein